MNVSQPTLNGSSISPYDEVAFMQQAVQEENMYEVLPSHHYKSVATGGYYAQPTTTNPAPGLRRYASSINLGAAGYNYDYSYVTNQPSKPKKRRRPFKPPFIRKLYNSFSKGSKGHVPTANTNVNNADLQSTSQTEVKKEAQEIDEEIPEIYEEMSD